MWINTQITTARQKDLPRLASHVMINVRTEVMLTHGVTSLNHQLTETGPIRDFAPPSIMLRLMVRVALMNVKSVDLATFGVTKTPPSGDTVHLINY